MERKIHINTETCYNERIINGSRMVIIGNTDRQKDKYTVIVYINYNPAIFDSETVLYSRYVKSFKKAQALATFCANNPHEGRKVKLNSLK